MRLLLLSTALVTAALSGLVPASSAARDRFPAEHWMQYADPAEAGFDPARLADAWEYWDSLDSAAFLVVVDGAVVVAWGDVDRRYLLHSARKSIMSAVYGIQVEAGKIDMGKTMAELGIDDENPPLTAAEKQATILDLIRARSGVYHLAAAEPPQNPKPAPGSHAPGTNWCYNNWDFNALCTILEQETGVKFFEEFDRAFARPLAMQDYRARDGLYAFEREKSIHPAYHIRMSARDMARFGHLFLHGGAWNGTRILSEDWVRESSRAHSTDAWGGDGYGYMWWVAQQGPLGAAGMYSARGVGVQTIDVLPGANMVVVHRVDTFVGRQVGQAEVYRLVGMILDAKVGDVAEVPELQPLPSIARPWKPLALDEAAQKTLCGPLELPGWGACEVRREGTQLLLENDFGTFDLVPLAADRFVVGDLEERFLIVRDAKGAVVQVLGEAEFLREGSRLLNAGRAEEALDSFLQAVEHFPASARAQNAAGEAFLRLGLEDEAKESFARVLEIDPHHANAAARLAELADKRAA